MVLAVTMVLFLLISTALAVTSTSRRITARYADFANLYDLAIAGNEQVLVKLNDALNQLAYNDDEEVSETFIAYAMPHLMGELANANMNEASRSNRIENPEHRALYFHWDFQATFDNMHGIQIQDRYSATTRVAHVTINCRIHRPLCLCYFCTVLDYTFIHEVFVVRTTIRKSVDGTEHHRLIPATVESFIVWDDKNIRNYLDDYMLTMVRLLRIAD